ncbi:hypothetical protein JCM8208_004602 [Rhodotorula glutinis]
MGLASKLAAAGVPAPGAAPGGAALSAYGAPPPQHQQHQQPQQQQYGAPAGPPPAYGTSYSPAPTQGGKASYAPPPGPPPAQGQYAPPSGPPPPVGYGGQQQSQYGQPQQQQQQQAYGAPPAPGRGPLPHTPAQGGSGAITVDSVLALLRFCVTDQKIQAFYPDPRALEPLAQRIVSSGALQQIASKWRLPMEIAVDLCKLSLFDVVLLIDDSGSMSFEEGGSRIDDAKLVIARVAEAASAFDDDGIQVRFLNSRVEGNGLRSEADALALVGQIRFSGMTPLGTSFDQKIIQPLILGPARAGQLKKPVLVIAVTDGQPGGEPRDTLARVLINASRSLQQTRYGADALSVTLAQIGNDPHARQFLSELDVHPEVGDLIDTTSNYEQEEDDFMRTSGMQLTPELWLVKMMMGGIDSSYDAMDEA